jgi:hypothetical protein
LIFWHIPFNCKIFPFARFVGMKRRFPVTQRCGSNLTKLPQKCIKIFLLIIF